MVKGLLKSGVVLLVLLVVMGCSATPQEEEKKTYPFLGTEWKQVSVTLSDGRVEPVEGPGFATFTFGDQAVTVASYDDSGNLQFAMPVPLLEMTSAYFVLPTSLDLDNDNFYEYTGTEKVWYAVSGNEMKFTNQVATVTNVHDPNDVTNVITVGPGSGDPYVVSLNFVAK